MKYLLLITLLFSQFPVQQSSTIPGKWTYVKFETKEILDDDSRAALNHAMSLFAWEFKEDGNFIFQKRKKQDTGTWKADNGVLDVQYANGTNDKIKYIQNHKDTLKLEVEQDKYIVFTREK